MRHFGVISPPVSGHIHPMSALGRELIARGHRVTYFQVLDLDEKIRAEGIDFEPIGERDHPRGSLPVSLKQLGQLHGLAALRFTIDAVAKTSEMVCRDLPAAIRRTGVDALLVDQMEPAGGAVAEYLEIPFVTICNALPLNEEASVPPPFTPWKYRDVPWARVRNRLGYAASAWMLRPVTRLVGEYRRAWGLRRHTGPDESFSALAQISQMPRDLDFPRRELPETFHYVGPLRRPAAAEVAFPWDRLDGRPVVYASLGTLQNSRVELFHRIAEACRGLDAQLVISHAGGLSPQQVAGLPGQPLVVSYAPQREVLSRARLTITHAGLNTVLDSVSAGVPLVLIPLTYEQPAIARRVEWAGAGVSCSLRRTSSRQFRHVIAAALSSPIVGRRASGLQSAMSATGSVGSAGRLIEAALAVKSAPDLTGRPKSA